MYTKGPWITKFDIVDRTYDVVLGYDPEKKEYPASEIIVGLKDADAFLIAAAPDMYKALRWIVKNLTTDEVELAREVWGNTNTRIILEAVEAGRQALAKAKGMD